MTARTSEQFGMQQEVVQKRNYLRASSPGKVEEHTVAAGPSLKDKALAKAREEEMAAMLGSRSKKPRRRKPPPNWNIPANYDGQAVTDVLKQNEKTIATGKKLVAGTRDWLKRTCECVSRKSQKPEDTVEEAAGERSAEGGVALVDGAPTAGGASELKDAERTSTGTFGEDKLPDASAAASLENSPSEADRTFAADGDGQGYADVTQGDFTAYVAEMPEEVDLSKFAHIDNLEVPPMPLSPELEEIRFQLLESIRLQDHEMVKQLLSPNERHVHVPSNLANQAGETLALCAARSGAARCCAAFLDKGANPMARDASLKYFGDGSGVWPDEKRPDTVGKIKSSKPRAVRGKTLVYYLRLHGLLEQTLSEVFPMTRVKFVKAMASTIQRYYQTTPLVVAAKQGWVDLTAFLLTHNAALPKPVLAAPPQLPPPVLGSAPRPGSSGSLRPSSESNIRRISSENLAARSDRAEALLVACAAEQYQVAQVLLAAGVTRSSIDTAKDKRGRTALHLAAAAGQDKIVDMMLESGASPSVWSRLGRQALHDACVAGHTVVALALVKSGASLESRVGDWGAEGKFEKQARAAGYFGSKPLEIAMECGHEELCERLQKCDGGTMSVSRLF